MTIKVHLRSIIETFTSTDREKGGKRRKGESKEEKKEAGHK